MIAYDGGNDNSPTYAKKITFPGCKSLEREASFHWVLGVHLSNSCCNVHTFTNLYVHSCSKPPFYKEKQEIKYIYNCQRMH